MLLKIAAAYIRVSTERQDEYSPDSQLKKVREYAEREGYQIPDEYVFYDDGISGRSAKKRNEFNRMIAMAKDKEHPFEVIYVWKFSRFARNQEEALVYKNLLKKNKVSVVSVSEPIPEGHFGTLIERIIEWMDEFYSLNLATEVTRGMTEKVTRGEPVCPAPFGYKNKDKTYIPDGENADIVKEVFDMYANGEGMRKIATVLNERGIRTQRGCKFTNRRIEYMLRNPAYIGKLRWSLDGTRAVTKRDFFNESVITIDGHHDAIISIDVWEAVQKRIDAEKLLYPKYAKREQPIINMTKGLVRCSSCGGTIALASAKSGKAQISTLQCCNYAKGLCHTSHSVTLPKLESAIIEGLNQALATQSFTMSPERKKVKEPKKIDYDKLIGIEERKMERAKSAYLAGIDDIEQYASNKADIEKKINELIELKEKETTIEPQNMAVFVNKVMEVAEFIENPNVSTEAKNEALRTIIDKIIYDKPNQNVSIYFFA